MNQESVSKTNYYNGTNIVLFYDVRNIFACEYESGVSQ